MQENFHHIETLPAKNHITKLIEQQQLNEQAKTPSHASLTQALAKEPQEALPSPRLYAPSSSTFRHAMQCLNVPSSPPCYAT